MADGKISGDAVAPSLLNIGLEKRKVLGHIERLEQMGDIRVLKLTQDHICALRQVAKDIFAQKSKGKVKAFLSRFIKKIVIGKEMISFEGSLEGMGRWERARPDPP